MSLETNDLLFDYDVAEWLADPGLAFDAFLDSYRFNRRKLRASSFGIYKGMFERLRAWAQQQERTLFDLGAAELEHFLYGRGLSIQTRHRYLLLFSNLFEHLAQLRAASARLTPVAGDNPARVLLLEREAPLRTDPDFLTESEVQQFIRALPPAEGWKLQRDRAMVLLLLGAGLRSSEALALKASDVIFKGEEILGLRVQAQKPRPARQVPIHTWAHSELSAWLHLREIYASGKAPRSVRCKDQRLVGPLLFPANLSGAALNPPTLFRQVKAILQRTGIVKRYDGPTLLRNSCGALWLQKHEPLQVSLWLGHATVRTTELLLPPARRSRHPDWK